MNARVFRPHIVQSDAARWSMSAAAVLTLHAGLIAAGMAWHTQISLPGVTNPAILVDLSPVTTSVAPALQPMDLAPGPDMQQADESSPVLSEPLHQEMAQEQIAPTPPQEKPDVEVPLQPVLKPVPPKQSVNLAPTPQKPMPVPKKPARAEAKKPTDIPPAPRTSAAPKADRQASVAATAVSGAAAEVAIASYNQRVAAHLQRFKQYPSAAKAAGEQGTAMLSFTVSRDGQVRNSRLAGSSGHSALDAETLAMIHRAHPLPSFPPDIKQASMSFTVPVRFSLR